MVLNPNVLVAESDVAAALGTSLVGSTYTVYGLAVPQNNFQSVMNTVASEETNTLGTSVYNTTDATLAGAVKSFQIADCAYSIAKTLKGYAATYFNFSVGDSRFDLALQHIDVTIQQLKTERDRQFNLVQSITPGDVLIDTEQPGYGATSTSVY